MEGVTIPGETLKSLLEDVFPTECRLVGSENLEDLCAGRREFGDRDTAFRLTSGETLAYLANVVTIVAFLWHLLGERRARRTAQQKQEEIVEEIEVALLAEFPDADAMPHDRRVTLIAAVMIRR